MQPKKVNNTHQKINLSKRLQKATWALLCMVAAVFLLIYGMTLTTNILSQLNPLNTTLNLIIAGVCYALIAAGFILLWQRFSRFLTQAFSGIED